MHECTDSAIMLLCILWSFPPPPLCVDSILHHHHHHHHHHNHPPSTVFDGAKRFNAPLGSWDVSRVTNMEWSEYIRACDIVHHQSPLLQHNAMYCLSDDYTNVLTLLHNHVYCMIYCGLWYSGPLLLLLLLLCGLHSPSSSIIHSVSKCSTIQHSPRFLGRQ